MKKLTLILALALLGLIFSSSTEEIIDWKMFSSYEFKNYDPSMTYYFRIPLEYRGSLSIRIEVNYYMGKHLPTDYKVDLCAFYNFPSDTEVIEGHSSCIVNLLPVLLAGTSLDNPTIYSEYYYYSLDVPLEAEYLVICLNTNVVQTLKTLSIFPKV